MSLLNVQSLLNAQTIATAFIAAAPRSVGGAFRIWDAGNPALLQQGVTPNRTRVVRREATSVALAWTFGLFTSALAQKLTHTLRMSKNGATLGVAIVSNILAEVVARAVAYRGVSAAGSSGQAGQAQNLPSVSRPPETALDGLGRASFGATPLSAPPLFQRMAQAAAP
ncbi:MAG: hypothetical protein IPK79_04395 [Vampirovibrionales bacterium]|nr:hypothetical protein [Vampirovibrionales bacterium]